MGPSAISRCDRAVQRVDRARRGDTTLSAAVTRSVLRRCAALLLVAASLAAQDAEPKLPCVALIGASVTGGFIDTLTGRAGENQTIPLRTALRAAWPEDRARVVDFSDVLMFTAPGERGKIEVERARRSHPDLVLAADFAFWFGYGVVSGKTPAAEVEARLALQRQGLALLDRIECPIIVGDYPDMAGADPNMLSPRQIPGPDLLARLNESLSAWAAARPRVRVFHLSEWVARVKSDREAIEWRGHRVPLPARAVLQTDRLHANRLGAVLLAHRLLALVPEGIGKGHALATGLPDFAELADRLDVGDELEELAPAPAATGEDRHR